MAEDADREATKLRLLAMAADYEARAGIELTEPASGESIVPTQDEVQTIEPAGTIAMALGKTVVAQRRRLSRPRQE